MQVPMKLLSLEWGGRMFDSPAQVDGDDTGKGSVLAQSLHPM